MKTADKQLILLLLIFLLLINCDDNSLKPQKQDPSVSGKVFINTEAGKEYLKNYSIRINGKFAEIDNKGNFEYADLDTDRVEIFAYTDDYISGINKFELSDENLAVEIELFPRHNLSYLHMYDLFIKDEYHAF